MLERTRAPEPASTAGGRPNLIGGPTLPIKHDPSDRPNASKAEGEGQTAESASRDVGKAPARPDESLATLDASSANSARLGDRAIDRVLERERALYGRTGRGRAPDVAEVDRVIDRLQREDAERRQAAARFLTEGRRRPSKGGDR